VSPLANQIDERLADMGIGGGDDAPLELDSLSRFELWLLLEDVTGREMPIELIASLRTVGDVRSWLSYLHATS
jgi:hypothetical protein